MGARTGGPHSHARILVLKKQKDPLLIGADVLAALEKQTGLSQDELLARLSRELPAAVDKYTPDGRLPGQNA
jgi:hypothetical protein